jgi:hypothetical protein
MGYYKNLEVSEQVELGDRKHGRRATYQKYRKGTPVVVLDRKWLTALLTATWLQVFVILALVIVGVLR